MKTKKGLLYLRFISVLLAAACSETIVAQNTANDSLTYQLVLQRTIKAYQENVGQSLLLFNGAEYTGSYPGTVGHPYFFSDSLQTGSVYYDGVLYQNISLKYDLVTNELITKGRNGVFIKIVPEKISSFTIGERRFVHLRDSIANGPASGFYESLHTGPLSVWAAHRKQAERSFRPEDPYHFTQYHTYYIQKGGRFYPVTNEKDLLGLMPTQKEAVKKFLRKERLRYKKSPEKTIVSAVVYANGLKS